MAKQTENPKIPRRMFLRDGATVLTAACLPLNLLSACQVVHTGADTILISADKMDEALNMMAGLAPLTNHGPMAAEALVALGRSDKVISFVESYKKRFALAYPEKRGRITPENWREALGDGNRVADWTEFFRRELKEAEWKKVLEKWSEVLAPGMSAAAAHGLLRTSHAVRSLSLKETEPRLLELAEGFGYWAAYYQAIPEIQDTKTIKLKPAEAINQVPVLPIEKRTRRGSIMIELQNLNGFEAFSKVSDSVEITKDSEKFLSEVTEIFTTIYLKNVNQRNYITLIHAVTGTTCLRSLLPHLSANTGQKMLRYGWQMAAALYSISASSSTNNLPEAKEIKRDELIDRAAVSNEEHAIKFTEACLREYALNPKIIYLQAAQDALGRLGSFD